jgi:exonuclease SbcC
MRLLKLRIKNIASLKGEHVVNFGEISSYSNLFAITGETGAGKSTILNSIGLALYGDIFKKTLNQIDVVTLGEQEGQIELIFQVRGKKYLAYWYVRTRKPNGESYAKTPTPTRYLYTLNGDDFSSDKTISDVKTEDLLNLDFDQFSKCVVLNQGEFAKFLMASFADRRAILEKLYPGDLLGNIVRVLKDELENLKREKEHMEIELKAIQDDGVGTMNIEELLATATRELTLHENWSELIEKLNDHFVSLSHYHQINQENLKRIETTKKDLASGTTTYNTLLKATEEAQNTRDHAQKIFDEKGPRLQELLKKEESLKNEKRHLESLVKDENKNRQESAEAESRLGKIKEEEKKLLVEREETVGKMKHRPEAIIANRNVINELVDLNEDSEKLRQQVTHDKEKLVDLEAKGKEIAVKFYELQNKLREIPEGLPEKLKDLSLNKEISQKSRSRDTELSAQIETMENSISDLIINLKSHHDQIRDYKEELTNVTASLKVQELMSAVSFCLFHPQTEEKNACPVCETPFDKGKLQDLRILAGTFNIGRLQEKEATLKSEIVRLETEVGIHSKSLTELQKTLPLIKEEKAKLLALIVPEDQLDIEISKCQKLAWDREQITPLLASTETELNKVRKDYKDAKDKLTIKDNELSGREAKFNSLAESVTAFIPDFTASFLPDLRLDLRLSVLLTELDGLISRVRNDHKHWNERKTELAAALATLTTKKGEVEASISAFTEELEKELKGESASEALKKITDTLKSAQSEFEKKENERQKQDGELKSFQSRLYTYDEQARDIGIQYEKEHKDIRELAQKELPGLSDSLTHIRETLKALDLPLTSPVELYVPIKDILEKEKQSLKQKTNEARSRLAHFQTKKADQEKRRDRIQLLELKRSELQKDLARRERMNEIIGKDELRTYVLSLVEENLIIVTNEELARLCQGRYEIIHQTKTNKLAPEFFILDKFRDGGIRKVSTLSGGETFMVSLAMALGLAEMTRGSAEIDTLFIDEGFGTLDQDSLEDVLDMLNQIQNRGLMVGIISHVKALTSTLPVNLNVQKRQDGTSSVRLVVN